MHLRPAEPADAMAVAGVHVRSWQAAYRTLISDEYLNALKPEDRAGRYTFGGDDPDEPATIVAVEAGGICGFATTGPTRDADVAPAGELYALYVDPGQWDTGVGRVLMAAARERLAGQGHTTAVLWVLIGNERADRFYRRDGWVPDGARRTEEVWGPTVDVVRYRRGLP